MTSYLSVETTAGPEDGPEIHLVQQGQEADLIGPLTGYNYSETAEESAGLRREAELGYVEAVIACEEGPEAANAAAERARAAADSAAVLSENADESFGTDYPGWNFDYDKQGDVPGRPSFGTREYSDQREEFNEKAGDIVGDAAVADLYADMAEEAADAIERGEECAPPFLTSDLKLPPMAGPADSLDASVSLAPPSDALADASTDMRNPLSADNPRFLKAYTEIASIEESRGRAPDAASERLAAVATVQSKADGLDAIGRVVMNADATRAFITNTEDPSALWAKRSTVDVAAAVATPVEASNARLDHVNILLAARGQDTARVEAQETYRPGPSLA